MGVALAFDRLLKWVKLAIGLSILLIVVSSCAPGEHSSQTILSTSATAKGGTEVTGSSWNIGKSSPSKPQPRSFQSMVYAEQDKVFMFGGWTGTTTADASSLNDLWSFDLNTAQWKQLAESSSAPHPLARGSAALGFDPATQTLLLFGGMRDPDRNVSVDDFWKYDLAANKWRQLAVSGLPAPGPTNPSLFWDNATRRPLLVGWVLHSSSATIGLWEYDDAKGIWSQISSGSGMYELQGSVAVYPSITLDRDTQQLIVYGGVSLTSDVSGSVSDSPDRHYYTEVYAFNLGNHGWIKLPSAGQVPTGAMMNYMIYDLAIHRCVVFESDKTQGQVLLDAEWTYDPANGLWKRLNKGSDAPDAFVGASVVYDDRVKQAILYGGVADGVPTESGHPTFVSNADHWLWSAK